MPNAWYLCPYKRRNPGQKPPARYCVMDDFDAQIRADGGSWRESEILGNHAIVKVRASAATLTAIAAEPLITRLPKSLLTDPLGDLSQGQRTAIKNKLNELGYPLAEIREALGDDLAQVTLGDVLRFAARRRLKPWYDAKADAISFRVPFYKPRLVQDLDEAVV